jgi:hypothetical protein
MKKITPFILGCFLAYGCCPSANDIEYLIKDYGYSKSDIKLIIDSSFNTKDSVKIRGIDGVNAMKYTYFFPKSETDSSSYFAPIIFNLRPTTAFCSYEISYLNHIDTVSISYNRDIEYNGFNSCGGNKYFIAYKNIQITKITFDTITNISNDEKYIGNHLTTTAKYN